MKKGLQKTHKKVSAFRRKTNLPLRASNWRCKQGLSDYLASKGVVAISDIDTRRLTRHLRTHGAQYGVLFDQNYILGYSYHYRQAKWSLEIMDINNQMIVDCAENCRPDYRISEVFGADLIDYQSFRYNRDHSVASVNRRKVELQSSETFCFLTCRHKNLVRLCDKERN